MSTSKTVFITGSSSGIGHSTALYFQKRGWNIVATMRHPEKERILSKLSNTLVIKLDVKDKSSIENARDQAIQRFGSVDAVVNNAGYGVIGAFEATDLKKIRDLFETNVFGLMEVTRAFLPHFRERKQGAFINISSAGGKVVGPLWSSYHATKFAIEAFSESIQWELKPLGIRVKLVEPGMVRTDFGGRSKDLVDVESWPDYRAFQNALIPKMIEMEKSGENPSVTAEIIYKAASDRSWRLRYVSGKRAQLAIFTRWLLPDRIFQEVMNQALSGRVARGKS